MSKNKAVKLFWICLGTAAVCLFIWTFICLFQRRSFPDVGDENNRFILHSVLWADILAFFIQGVFTVLFTRQLKKGSRGIAGEIVVFVLLNFILVWLLNKADSFSVTFMAAMGGMPAVSAIGKLKEIKKWLLQFDPKVLFYIILGMSIYCKRRYKCGQYLRMLLYMTVGFHCINLLTNIVLFIYKEPLTTFYGLLGDTFNPPPVLVYLLPDLICFSVQLIFLLLFMMQLRRNKFSILPEILGIILLHSLSLWVPVLIQTWTGRLGGHSMLAWHLVLERVKRDINQMGGVATGIFFIACGISISIKMNGRKYSWIQSAPDTLGKTE